MNKFLLSMLAIALLALPASAQNYSFTTPKTLYGTVYENGFLSMTANFVNTANTDIYLKMELVSNSLLSSWDKTICDYQNCYPFVPDSSTMNPLPAGETGLISLSVNPYSNLGSGELKFYMWEVGNYANGDTVTFIVDAVTGIEEQNLAEQIQLYPNPVQNTLKLDVPASFSLSSATISNAAGKVMMTTEVSGNQMDISSLPAGMYFIRLDVEGQTLVKKFIKQ